MSLQAVEKGWIYLDRTGGDRYCGTKQCMSQEVESFMSYLDSLSIFCMVVEEGSFSAAAKKLGVTQPTISFHVDNLERKVGCQLLIRTLKGVSPTVYGEKLYASTHKIEAIVQETYKEIASMVKGDTGHIVLGASSIPADYILPPLIGQFLQAHPGITVSVKSGDSDNILTAYEQNDISIAIIGHRPPDSSLYQPLWEDELLLVAHPALAQSFSFSDGLTLLQTVPMIIRETSSGTRKTLSDALANAEMTLEECRIVLEVSSNQALKSAVLSQTGIAFISRWAVEQELSSGSLTTIPLPGFSTRRQFYALTRAPLLPTCVRDFWNFLQTSG